MAQRSNPTWAQPPQHTWSLDEIKLGNVISTYSLNDIIKQNNSKLNSNTCTFGRIADNPTLVDIVTAHESCSRVHARIAFDNNGTPWLKCLGSANGTFVNEKRLPPEACGKEDNNSNRKGSRGVVVYPGDAIRFGASTRLYILEGPEEYERGAIKLKQKMNEESSAMAAAAHSANEGGDDEEGGTANSNDNSCSWGMSDDIDTTADETEQQAAHPTAHDDNSNLPPLPSIEQFFYAQDDKYKISAPLYQLHSTYNTKTNKLQAIQKESSRIMAKENMGLTDGQQAQLAKNQERITTLEKEINNLKNRIEDGMHNSIHGGQRKVKKRQKERSQYNEDDEIDDFYDRTASKRQRLEDVDADSEESLISKWKALIEEHTKQQQLVSRALDRCTTLQQQIDSSKEDDDAFFIQNDLDLDNENLAKAQKAIEETNKELDNVEYLLKIVNPKLEWDRKERLIGTDTKQMRHTAVKVPTADDSMITKPTSTMMPPPPPVKATTSESLMPPPPPQTMASTTMPPPPSKSVMPEQVMMPPPKPVDTKSNDEQSSMSPPAVQKDVPPKKKKIKGPQRPPSNIQGTLAALTHEADSRTGATSTDSQQKKKTQVISNPKEDMWKAPADQDGSGRTALNDKFKGRY